MELEQRTASLEASEQRYRALVELSPDAIFILNGGIFLFMNGKAAQVFGGPTPLALVGKTIAQCLHANCPPAVLELFRTLHKKTSLLQPVELTLVRNDSTTWYAELAAAPVSFEGKKAAQVIIR